MNHSTEKMLMEEIPRIREALERMSPKIEWHTVMKKEDGLYHELKPGVTMTKNGRYMKDGKFISKDEAYA